MLVAFSALWALGYSCIELAEDTIPPVTMMALRSASAAAALLLLCRALGRPLREARPWHPAYVIPAFLLSSFPWSLTGEGELYIDAGLTSVMTSLTPLSTFVIGALILRTEHSRWYRVLGLAVSLVGLVMAIGLEHLAQARVSFYGLGLVSTAFTLYGINGILLAKYGRGLDPLVTCTYAIGYGAVLLAAGAFLLEEPLAIRPRWDDLAATGFLGVVITAGGYALYFTTVQRAGALFASTWGYLVPAFGIVVSAVALGTPLGWSRLGGTALVIGGVMLVNLKGRAAASIPPRS